MKQRNRFLSILLTFCMIAGLMPWSAADCGKLRQYRQASRRQGHRNQGGSDRLRNGTGQNGRIYLQAYARKSFHLRPALQSVGVAGIE